MIRFPSAVTDYDFYVSTDPAFKQRPEDEEGAKVYDATLAAARRTGDYSALLPEGQTPTKFVLGQVDRVTFRAIMDRYLLPKSEQRSIGDGVMAALMFRLAIRDIPALGKKIEHKRDPDWDGWKMAPADLVGQMDSADPSIVLEIGRHVYAKLVMPDPLD